MELVQVVKWMNAPRFRSAWRYESVDSDLILNLLQLIGLSSYWWQMIHYLFRFYRDKELEDLEETILVAEDQIFLAVHHQHIKICTQTEDQTFQVEFQQRTNTYILM